MQENMNEYLPICDIAEFHSFLFDSLSYTLVFILSFAAGVS